MPNLRDIAARATVMGECWICDGKIPCDDPDRCGIVKTGGINNERVTK